MLGRTLMAVRAGLRGSGLPAGKYTVMDFTKAVVSASMSGGSC